MSLNHLPAALLYIALTLKTVPFLIWPGLNDYRYRPEFTSGRYASA